MLQNGSECSGFNLMRLIPNRDSNKILPNFIKSQPKGLVRKAASKVVFLVKDYKPVYDISPQLINKIPVLKP